MLSAPLACKTCVHACPSPLQVAVVWMLALRAGDAGAAAPPAVRLLLWGTRALSGAILALSLLPRERYAELRPWLLGAARTFYALLWPQLVWHLASAGHARVSPERQTLTAFFLLWVTWTRWGSELLLRESGRAWPAVAGCLGSRTWTWVAGAGRAATHSCVHAVLANQRCCGGPPAAAAPPPPCWHCCRPPPAALTAEAGYLLPFSQEALLAPMAALLDMLNNVRLCRCRRARGRAGDAGCQGGRAACRASTQHNTEELRLLAVPRRDSTHTAHAHPPLQAADGQRGPGHAPFLPRRLCAPGGAPGAAV